MTWQKLFENPITTAEWWRDIPVGQRVRVVAQGPDRKYAGQEGTFQGFSKPHGYAVVVDARGRRLQFHPESLEPVILSNPRPTKGEPTDLNLWALNDVLEKGGGVIGLMAPTDIPHVRRCLKAGLLEPAGPKQWKLSPKGEEVLGAWREREAASKARWAR